MRWHPRTLTLAAVVLADAGYFHEVEGLDENLAALDVANFQRMIEKAVANFPNFKAVATTLRNARTASVDVCSRSATTSMLQPSRW